MFYNKKLWSVSFAVPADKAGPMSDVLGESALAVTILAPPRTRQARIEAIYGAPPDGAALTASLAIAALLNGIAAPKLTLRELPKLDWLKKVAEDFPPLRIARWTIHGAQHRKAVRNRRLALQIDATSAFGTGEHPTTRGCLLALDALLKKKPAIGKMLDMGCGSGILAMAFVKATRSKAVAADIDADSVVISRGNAKANGLGENMRIVPSFGYRARAVHKGAPYGLIMSNIFAGPLSHMAKDLKKHLRPGGYVILAGLLNHQANRVLAAHRMQKLYLVRRLTIGEWSILALRRRESA